MVKIDTYKIIDNHFEYDEKIYDCSLAIRRDISHILQEAEIAYKESFDELYDKQSLKPNKVRVFFDEKDSPIFGMVIYLIAYNDGSCQRYACGGYYRFLNSVLCPHPYQESICW